VNREKIKKKEIATNMGVVDGADDVPSERWLLSLGADGPPFLVRLGDSPAQSSDEGDSNDGTDGETTSPTPDLEVAVSFTDLMDIFTEKVAGMAALQQGKLAVLGNRVCSASILYYFILFIYSISSNIIFLYFSILSNQFY
jgi:hypothetical protein